MNARRTIALTSMAAGIVLVWPAVASAHIEPSFTEIPAGQPATVAFDVEHGCGDAATTQLEVQIPESVTDAEPVDKDGWTASVDGDVVTFSGGEQDAHTATDFAISFTAPDTEGEELRFPIVQTCGSDEVAWIEASEDDEHPAPVVLVGAADSTPVTAAAHDDEGEDEEGGDEGGTTATTAAGEASAPTGDASDDGSSALPIVVGVAVAVVVVAGGLVLVRSRRSS